MSLEQTLNELRTTDNNYYLSTNWGKLRDLVKESSSNQGRYNLLLDGLRSCEVRLSALDKINASPALERKYRIGMLRYTALLALAADNNVQTVLDMVNEVDYFDCFKQRKEGSAAEAFLKYTGWTPAQATDLLLNKKVPESYKL